MVVHSVHVHQIAHRCLVFHYVPSYLSDIHKLVCFSQRSFLAHWLLLYGSFRYNAQHVHFLTSNFKYMPEQYYVFSLQVEKFNNTVHGYLDTWRIWVCLVQSREPPCQIIGKVRWPAFGWTPTLVLLQFAAPSLGEMTAANLSAKYLASLALVGLAWAQARSPLYVDAWCLEESQKQFFQFLEILYYVKCIFYESDVLLTDDTCIAM